MDATRDGPFNVMFTSVGRRVELLRAFRRAYQALGLRGRIIAVDIDPLAPALQLADRPYLVPNTPSEEFIPELIEICRREQVHLVFPLIDPDIPVLSHHRKALQATGAQLAVVRPEAAAITGDKRQTHAFFRKLGLAAPRSWLPGEMSPADADFPLFIKPRRGSGAKHTFKLRCRNDLAFFAQYVSDPLIQEFLPGPEITTDVICDLKGELLSLVSRQRIEVRCGEVAKGVTVYDQTIADACVKMARALPAVGPFTVQSMLKEGVHHFTEINARLGGGVPLGIAAGVDSPRWLLASAAGLPVVVPPLGSYRVGLYLTRFDESFFLDEADHARLASHCV